MQVTAIIAEWNPLHRGHLLPVQAARQQGATHIVAILSGNFVQRGEPALCPWQYRAAAALSSGVDLAPPAAAALCRFHCPALCGGRRGQSGRPWRGGFPHLWQ